MDDSVRIILFTLKSDKVFDDCFREVIFRGLSCCTATLAQLLGHPDIVEVSDAVESIPSSRSSLCSGLDILSLLYSFSVLSVAIAVDLFGFYEKNRITRVVYVGTTDN